MQIRRIEVRDFRKLRHVVVAGLGPGLNVLVGDNEAGKSTLLAALRAALFERHRVGGRVLEAMLPHGHLVRPEITLDFMLQGAPYRLHKAFNQRPEAELTLPGGRTITGDAVEERLAALLGFAAPGQRGSRPDEHQGVFGLLWVDQGLAHAPLAVGAGRDGLAAALEHELGQVLGGERGRRLLLRARERRDAVWDKRGTNPRGAFRQRHEAIAAMEAQRNALAERLARYEAQIETLAEKTTALAVIAREGRLATAVQATADTGRHAAAADQLQATLAELSRAEARALTDRDTVAERLQRRQALAERSERAEAALARAADEADAARTALGRAAVRAEEARTAHGLARDHRREADGLADAIGQRRARARAREAAAATARTLDEATTVAADCQALRAAIAGNAVTASALAHLDRLCAARDQARSRRDAASVRLLIEAESADAILVDGLPHATATPLLLAGDAVLDLPGFGRLRVQPGGGVDRLARALAAADATVEAALRALGQPSREAAAAAQARRQAAEAERAAQDRLLAMLAPAGLPALQAKADGLKTTAPPAGAEDGPAPTSEEHEQADHRRATAQRAEDEAAQAADQANGTREAAGHKAAMLTERAQAAAADRAAALALLAEARATLDDDRLRGALLAADRALTLATEAARTAESALRASDPDAARARHLAARADEDRLRAVIEALARDRRDIEVELQTLGQEGFGEELAETEGRLAAARQELAQESLEAQASLLLHKTLLDAQRDSRDRWLGPVRDRVQPYLAMLQPGSSLILNETTFGIEQLVRAGVPEPFESLSVGAREQIAVITRLALADILRSAGQPAAVILDDALVNTDEARLGRMHRILQRAASSMQVLVLTCREDDFASLAAPVHRLVEQTPAARHRVPA